mmetsp:Transcript_10743/g.15398  ORF Transcript_10743/g.15398 Transcript_10743/m.15398 type:complete len:226 (-) Transcript_10743:183-860(-)
MVTAEVEVKRRQCSLVAGMLFGVGWLVFIDSIVNFNACWDRVDYGDPCQWGRAPVNGTHTPHGTPAPSPESNNIWPMPDWPIPAWVPGQGPHTTTPAPPPPHGGWEPISGRYKIVYVPGIFAMMALFMVNSVNAQDLSEDHTETAVGAVPGALKLWLSGGMTLGIVAVIMAIWSYVDVWARHDDIKDGPGSAAITQSLLIVISAAVFFVARAIGSDEGWGQDPLL